MLNVNELIGFGVGGVSPHRYWRIRNTALVMSGGTPVQFVCVELKWRNIAGGEISVGGTPFASSTATPYVASRAHDNVFSTVNNWQANVVAVGEWIAYDFNSQILPSSLDFALYSGTLQLASIALDFSDNAANWTQHREYTGLSGWVSNTYKNFIV